MASPVPPARRIWEICICGCAFAVSKINATRDRRPRSRSTSGFRTRKAAQRKDGARECGRCERDVYVFLVFYQDIPVRTRRANIENGVQMAKENHERQQKNYVKRMD